MIAPTATTKIPCQQFSFCTELVPQSRYLLSNDARLALNVIDSTICNCLYVILLKDLTASDGCKCAKEDEDLHVLVSEFEDLAVKYNQLVCGDRECKQPILHTQQKPDDTCYENDLRNMDSQQKFDSLEAPSEVHEGKDTSETPRNEEGYSNANEKSQLQDELVYLTHQITKTLNRSPLAEELMGRLVAVTPKSSFSASLLNLPYSISRFIESSPEIVLSTSLGEQKHNLMSLLLRLRCACFTEMLNTPEDRKRKKKFLKEIRARLNKSIAKIENLSRELEEVNEKNKTEATKTENKVNELQGEINNLQSYMLERVKRIQDEEQQRKKVILDSSEEKQRQLEKELYDLKVAYKKMVEDNQNVEGRERNQIFKMEAGLESMIGKFDQEMSVLQGEYDQLDEEYTKEKRELTELEEKFSTLEVEYLKIMEKRRLEEEKRREEEEVKRVIQESITTIQAFWRSYQTRKIVRGRRGGAGKAQANKQKRK